MSETLKVQISRTVQSWLDGTHVGQCPTKLDEHGYGWEGQNLIRKIDEAPRTRKDGTVTVHLLPQEAVALADLADTMHQTNLDEFSMFGEARAGASLVEKLRVLGVNVPPMRYEFGTDPNPYDDGDDGDGGTADTDDPLEVMFYERDLDADDRLVFQPHHDRIVVKDRGDIYLALPYSPGPLPTGTALVISIRDSSPNETVRTTRPIDELAWLIVEALDRAETMGRYPDADEIGIHVEDVTTLAG